MKPSERERANTDFLGGAFVTLPYAFLEQFASLGLEPQEFLILMQILAASQVRRTTDLSAQEIATLCGTSPNDVMYSMDKLLRQGFLAIGERLDAQGTHSNYYDLQPLWNRLRGKDPKQNGIREWRKDPVTLFEEEFGRPLSGLECEQIRQWMELDGHPDWLILEALREAVLANKYSFKYIDRILFDWQRNRIRSRQELDMYRQSYRDRTKSREEIAATSGTSATTTTTAKSAMRNTQSVKKHQSQPKGNTQKDDRYTAFYQLFPDS